jgi:hypothetical protein
VPWFWTDDLADLLIEQDGVDPATVADWKVRPAGLSAPETVEPLEYARMMLRVEAVA